MLDQSVVPLQAVSIQTVKQDVNVTENPLYTHTRKREIAAWAEMIENCSDRYK